MVSKLFAILLVVCVAGQKHAKGKVQPPVVNTGGNTGQGNTGQGNSNLQQGNGAQGNNNSTMATIPIPTAPCDQHVLVRSLFNDHQWYTNDYIVASVFHQPTTPALKQRLLLNQQQIGSSLGKMFSKIGQNGGQQITQLLTGHIVAADGVIQASVINAIVQMIQNAPNMQGGQGGMPPGGMQGGMPPGGMQGGMPPPQGGMRMPPPPGMMPPPGYQGQQGQKQGGNFPQQGFGSGQQGQGQGGQKGQMGQGQMGQGQMGQQGQQGPQGPPRLPSPQVAKADLANKTNVFNTQGDQVASGFAQLLGLPADNFKTAFRTHNQHILTLLDDLLQKQDADLYVKDLDASLLQMGQIADVIFNGVSGQGQQGQNQTQGQTQGQQGQTTGGTKQTQTGQSGGSR